MKTEKVIEILRSANDIGYGVVLEGDTGEIKEALEVAKQAVEIGDVYLLGKDINPYLEGYKEGMADYKRIVEENEKLKSENEKLKSEISKVKRPQGEWERDDEHSITFDIFKCSHCGGGGHTHFRFCPNCGASMTEEV